VVVVGADGFDAQNLGLKRRKAKVVRLASRRLDFDERAGSIDGVQFTA
jgi:hypothetical protein